MTKLTKPVRREVQTPGIRKPVIVEIDPETKKIGFREKGSRQTYWLPIGTVFALAIRAKN